MTYDSARYHYATQPSHPATPVTCCANSERRRQQSSSSTSSQKREAIFVRACFSACHGSAHVSMPPPIKRKLKYAIGEFGSRGAEKTGASNLVICRVYRNRATVPVSKIFFTCACEVSCQDVYLYGKEVAARSVFVRL